MVTKKDLRKQLKESQKIRKEILDKMLQRTEGEIIQIAEFLDSEMQKAANFGYGYQVIKANFLDDWHNDKKTVDRRINVYDIIKYCRKKRLKYSIRDKSMKIKNIDKYDIQYVVVYI